MYLRQRLLQPEALNNLFQVTNSPETTEWLSRMDVGSLTLDLQHGTIDTKDLLHLLQAAEGSDAYMIARLPWNSPETIMKVLDMGVNAIICPMIETAEDVQNLVQAAKYPPLGKRSFGIIRSSTMCSQYYTQANEHILCFAMIETAEALDNLNAIAATPGLDGIFLGTADLSISCRLPSRGDLADPDLMAMVDQTLAAAKKHNLFSGIFTMNHEDAKAMETKGFDLVACGSEKLIFQEAVKKWITEASNLQPA